MEQQAGDTRPPAEHPKVLQNETPNFLTDAFLTVVLFLQTYGWFLLIGVAVLIYAKTKLDPLLQRARERRQQTRDNETYDSSVTLQRQEAMETARQRLQEKHDAQAARFLEEQKKKEEEKRQEKIEDWERHQRGEGYRNKYKPQEGSSSSTSTSTVKPKGKNVYRSAEYNPLGGGGAGGGGGGTSYRPSRRGGGGGGG